MLSSLSTGVWVQTFDENLADILAVELVAGREWSRLERQPALPGVAFTQQQALLVAMAQSYCGDLGVVSQVLHGQLGLHATYRER